MDFITSMSTKTEIPARQFARWAGIASSKFQRWRKRYGKVNEHNGKSRRDHQLLPWEVRAILRFHEQHPLEGYRRLAFMMLDHELVAVSPSTVYRVLKAAGVMDRWNRKPSKKGKGFKQPKAPHRHWHIDFSHLNIAGTFYYLCAILDGYSRLVVHWEIRESMTEKDIEIIMQRAKEMFPDARPRIISDNVLPGQVKSNSTRTSPVPHVEVQPATRGKRETAAASACKGIP